MSDPIYMVKQLHSDVEVWRNGELVLQLRYEDTAALAAMLTYAAEQARDAIEEDYADARAESRALEQAEHDWDCQRERMNEMDFSQKGYDDVPF